MDVSFCGSIHQGHEWFSDDSRRRQEIFLLGKQFCRFANGGAKIYIDQVPLRDILFFLSVFNNSEVLGKNASIRSKLPTAACWSREE